MDLCGQGFKKKSHLWFSRVQHASNIEKRGAGGGLITVRHIMLDGCSFWRTRYRFMLVLHVLSVNVPQHVWFRTYLGMSKTPPFVYIIYIYIYIDLGSFTTNFDFFWAKSDAQKAGFSFWCYAWWPPSHHWEALEPLEVQRQQFIIASTCCHLIPCLFMSFLLFLFVWLHDSEKHVSKGQFFRLP